MKQSPDAWAGLVGRSSRTLRSLIAMLPALLLALGLAATEGRAAGRYAAMAVDANTGQVLHAEAAAEPRYPASLTKLMTLYIVFERLEQGRLKPETRIRISPQAASVSPSKLGLEAGATISVADAAKALITKSANDIAVAVAEHIAGDEARFAALMTAKARELGMTATTFRNAHGLPDREQVTTARDMLTLALRLYDSYPAQARLFAMRSFTYAGRSHRNHNTMLDSFAGMDGMKTGYTSSSGFNLVASVRRDGRHVVAAVFGGTSAAARNARMRIILTRALQQASGERTRKPLVVASRVPVRRAPAAEPPSLRKVPEPAARPVSAAPAAPAVPVAKLVEPVMPARRTPPAPDPVQVSQASAEPRESAADWRAKVRVAAPVQEGASVASHLGAAGRDGVPDAAHRGARQPSTLQAQAMGLAASRLPGAGADGQAQPLPLPPSGGVHVQIGAYPDVAEARRRLDAVRPLIAKHLHGASAATPSVTVGGRTLYRARFTGLEPAVAANVCTALRRQQIDCLVGRTE